MNQFIYPIRQSIRKRNTGPRNLRTIFLNDGLKKKHNITNYHNTINFKIERQLAGREM